MPAKDYEYLFKLVIIGDSGVGKSSILLRFADDSFTESYLTTIGVDFRFRTIQSANNKRVKLQIWDTAGQERFRTMTSAYYRGSDGIVLVYDVTDRNSFDHIESWLAEVNRFTESSPAKLLIGNKSDLQPEREISFEEGTKKAEQLGLKFIEVSAKSSDHIEQAFAKIAASLIFTREATDAAVANIRPTVAPFNLRDRFHQANCCQI